MANQIVSKSIYGAMPKILFELYNNINCLFLVIYFSLNGLPLKDLFAQILIYSVAVYRLLPQLLELLDMNKK